MVGPPRRLLTQFDVLRERPFRLFFLGHVTSLVGRSMTPVALTFAVLQQGGGASEVGLVLMAKTAPLAIFALVGGAVGDRIPRKLVMVSADITRCASQGVLAGLLLLGEPSLWQFMVLAAILGLGEAFFLPSMTGLIPEVTSPERLQDANALRSSAASAGKVVGPALAGVIVAAANPGWAIAADAVAYAVSALFLARLPLSFVDRAEHSSVVQELREGWREFRSRRWLWVIVVQFGLVGLFVLPAFMVLGAVVAEESLGGATAWGTILAVEAVGAVCGGLVIMRVRPRRPLRVGIAGLIGFALPLGLLALRAPVEAVVAAAFVSGIGIAVFDTLWDTTLQQQVPAAALSRVSSYDVLGSVALIPVGYALVGPFAAVLGTSGTLWLATGFMIVSNVIVLALPGVTQLRAQQVKRPTGQGTPSSAGVEAGAPHR